MRYVFPAQLITRSSLSLSWPPATQLCYAGNHDYTDEPNDGGKNIYVGLKGTYIAVVIPGAQERRSAAICEFAGRAAPRLARPRLAINHGQRQGERFRAENGLNALSIMTAH